MPRFAKALLRRALLAASAGGAAARSAADCPRAWSNLADGTNANTLAAAIHDADGDGPEAPRLIVGGDFTLAGGGSAAYVASWDGAAWSPLGLGLDGTVRKLVELDEDAAGPATPVLYAGGVFSNAGGGPAGRVARWNGASWSALGSGVTGPVLGMCAFDDDGAGGDPPTLIVGGAFATAGGAAAQNIARWTPGAPGAWSALGDGLNGTVWAATEFDGDGDGPNPPRLIAGGDFTMSGSTPVSHVAEWDGRAWLPLGAGVSGTVLSLTTFDEDGSGPLAPVLICGGSFTSAGGAPANFIARWDGGTWSPLGNGTDNIVFALAGSASNVAPADVALYAGGDFTHAGGAPAAYVARWMPGAPGSWSALDRGVGSFVRALALGPADSPRAPLFVAGDFTTAGGASAGYVAEWSCATGGSCPADLDDDGTIGQADLALLLSCYDQSGNACGDVDGDGATTQADLAALLAVYDTMCPRP